MNNRKLYNDQKTSDAISESAKKTDRMAIIEVNVKKEQRERILITGKEDPNALAYRIALKHGNK